MVDYAVIDIGSNSVRLMTLSGGKVVDKMLTTTRLGEGLFASEYLKAEAIERTARAVALFFEQATAKGAKKVYAFATAAVRTAKNRKDFLLRVQELCALDVDVISGEEEAMLGISGALGESDGALVDVGGASTEFVIRKGGDVLYRKSVNIGVVRLKDKCGRDAASIERECERVFEEFGKVEVDVPVYAIGGTATTLAAMKENLKDYDGERVTGKKLTLKELSVFSDELLSKPIEEIAKHPCVDLKRAEVLGGGAKLLFELCKRLSVTEMIVEDSGNLEGYARKKGLL